MVIGSSTWITKFIWPCLKRHPVQWGQISKTWPKFWTWVPICFQMSILALITWQYLIYFSLDEIISNTRSDFSVYLRPLTKRRCITCIFLIRSTFTYILQVYYLTWGITRTSRRGLWVYNVWSISSLRDQKLRLKEFKSTLLVVSNITQDNITVVYHSKKDANTTEVAFQRKKHET